MANIIQTFPKNSGTGHTILGDSGAVPQEKNLKISGMSVTDVPADEITQVAPAQLNEDSLNDVCNGSIGTNFITPSTNYSSNEQIIGKWIDGKPVYQKTFTGTVASQNSFANFGTISNYDKIIGGQGMQNYSGTAQIPLSYVQSGTDRESFYISSSGQVMVGGYYTGFAVITIQYTKTTDT